MILVIIIGLWANANGIDLPWWLIVLLTLRFVKAFIRLCQIIVEMDD